ncbi:MAG: bifunctional demethylmenaquinone methyltransferase/2-methoxy-6-polyprenyl-1,4-benzoquinol methylase UbiE [Hyphomicrobiaceae bacterium]
MELNRLRGAATANTFGFKAIDAEQRQSKVNEVFASVAQRYDLMNDLMSAGLHRLWKDDLVARINPPRSPERFTMIDVAGGTGDIAMRCIHRGGRGCHAIVYDISREMLAVSSSRIAAAGAGNRINPVEGNAERLAFAESSFDAYAVAFGLRNVTYLDRALSEAYRVLKPGGHFLCLEFSKCTVPMLDRLYDFHSFEVIPRLGHLAVGDRDSYQYLVESIRQFPEQEPFAQLIRDAGFSNVSYQNLTGGIAAIHSAWRI